MPDQGLLDHARRLFATMLDAPGGLGIKTIHAFCQSLLRRFPVEAGIPPHFQLLDERAAGELLANVREEVLAEAREGTTPELATAVTTLARRVGEARFWTLLDLIAAARTRFQRLLERTGGVREILDELARQLGLAARASEASVISEACAECAFDGEGLRHAATAMSTGTQSDRERGEVLASWLDDRERRGERFGGYCEIFFTREGPPRARLLSKAVATVTPTALICLEAEARRLEIVRARCAAAALFETTAAVTHLAIAMLRSYERHKRAQAVLDYEDLIAHSVELLERPGVAIWVLFKLDGGLDHILIDEIGRAHV